MEGCGTYDELVRSGLEAGKYAYSETSFYNYDARTENHDDDDGIVTSTPSAVLQVDQPEPYLRAQNQHQTTPQNTLKSETPSTTRERPKTPIPNKEDVKTDLHNYLLLTSNKVLLLFCFVFLVLMFSLITCWDLGYFFWSQYLRNNSDSDEVFHRPLAWLWFTLAGLGFVTVFCYILIHKILINNARQLHRSLVSVLLRASITELDRNKKGIFLNYFASEMRIIDESLPATFLDSIQYLLVVISGFIMIGFASAWLLIPILILSFGVITITRLAFPVLTQLKKLQMRRTKSFEAHLQTTLDGLVTIRALGLEKSYYSQYAQIHRAPDDATSSTKRSFESISKLYSQNEN